MKAVRTLSGLLTFYIIMSNSVLTASMRQSDRLREALSHAGCNLVELEIALREVKGKDTEYLIANASQYDLANLTAQQIIENVTYARKVHEALPYLGEKLEYDLWRDWVLPHRVLEEDVSLWRKDFYERMQPVIAGKTTTAEVAESIRNWLWGNGMGAKQVTYGAAENRLRVPTEVLKGGTASCGELAAMHVSFLRAVGIPARHCCGGWYQGKEGWHFYTEYWDNQLRRWVATDDVPDTPVTRVQRGAWRPLVAHAVPGFHEFANAYYTEDFSGLLDVTVNLGEVLPFRFRIPGQNRGNAAVAVWNTMEWRKVTSVESDGPGSFFRVALAQTKWRQLPVLVTVVRDRELLWGLLNPGQAGESAVLQSAKSGVCLRWVAGKSVEAAAEIHNYEP